MKKLIVLCALPLLLAACHCERRTTGTPCGKDTCETAPVAVQLPEVKAPVVLPDNPGLFRFDSAAVSASFNQELVETANILVENPEIKVNVNGYTDSTGSAAYNLGLSKRRAQAAADVLIKNGVAAENIAVYGYGEEYPVASNATAEGRAKNRRVEIKVNEK